MRISQLSARAGLPVATVKFYLRAGLLHPGRATSATQALYDETHLSRLRLVRALLEIGHLSLAEIHRVLDAAEEDAPQAVVREVLAGDVPSGTDTSAAARVAHDVGWTAPHDSPHLAQLAQVLAGFEAIGVDVDGVLPAYAVAAELVARTDADVHGSAAHEAELAATVLSEALLGALHRLAAEHVDAERRADRARVPLPRSPQPHDRVATS